MSSGTGAALADAKTTEALLAAMDRVKNEHIPPEIRDYEAQHPDFFPAGTTTEQKIKHLEKIRNEQKRVVDQKHETFHKLDEMVETAAIDKAAAKEKSEIAETADKIYEGGEFLEYCKKTYGKVWLNDVHILEGILYTAANMRVLNAKDGIHLHIMGLTQTGKSDSVKAAMQFVHPSDRLIKTFSMKYLFYAAEDLHPNTIVFSDDTIFEPETASLYRNMLTSWFTGVTRGTVVNHTKKDLHIPARVSLILTSVESVVLETDDGQDESRFLTLEVRRTPDQMAAIRQFIQEDHPDIKPALDVVYAVWTAITPRKVKIHKILDKDIPIREFKRYLTLVQAHALLCNRTTTTDADFVAIDHFLTYSKPMINSTTPAFTRKEAAVLGCLVPGKMKAVADIVSEASMTIQDVYRAVHGREGTFQNPRGGLMAKEPRLLYARERTEGENDIHRFGLRS
jgi:hypothetical protein